jgi:hypothetical protein
VVRGKLQVSSSSCDASGVSCSCGGEVEGLLKAKAVNQVDAIGGGKGGGGRRGRRKGRKGGGGGEFLSHARPYYWQIPTRDASQIVIQVLKNPI